MEPQHPLQHDSPDVRKTLTYRVRGIPLSVHITALQESLKKLLESQDIRVDSLAPSSITRQGQVATIRVADSRKLSNTHDEWRIPAGRTFAAETDNQREQNLVIDSHFRGLTPLYSPASDADHCVDCIAISGLGSHAFGSWKDRNSHYMWLRDALPHDLPSGRVLTYGYDTRLAESTSFQNLEDVALTFCASLRIALNDRPPDRPLIFVAHSLGGLVLKQALIQMASGDDVARRIFQSTYGILFFGVPNQGMDISSLLAMVRSQPNLPFLTMFSKDGGSLHALVERFRTVFDFKDSQIISLYETCASRTAMKNTNGKWSMSGDHAVLVDRYSARSGRSWEESSSFLQPIARNHSDMVKFSEYDDVGVIVANFLIRFATAAPAIIEIRIHSRDSTKTWGPADAQPSAPRQQSLGEGAKLEWPERPVEGDGRAVNLQRAIVQQSIKEKEPRSESQKAVSKAALAQPKSASSLGPGPPTPPAPPALAAQSDPTVAIPPPRLSTSNTPKENEKFVRPEKSFLDEKAEQQAGEAPGSRKKEDDLRIFADAGFDMEVRESRNRGLTWAARKGHFSLVQQLLNRGTDPNKYKDEALWTALHWAAFTANLNLFRLLLSRKADIHAKSKRGHSMLHLVSSFSTDHRRREFDDYTGSPTDRIAIGLELLKRGLPIDIKSFDKDTPLLCAATYGLEDMVVMLISKGAYFSYRNQRNDSPLLRAAEKGHIGVIKAIIKIQGKGFNNPGVGWCLVKVASKGMEPAVRVLLDAGVMTDVVDYNGNTALISAVGNRSVDIVQLLLDKGANVEFSQNGETPLIRAVDRNHEQERNKRSQLETIKLLIDKGANVHAGNKDGITALHRAVQIMSLGAADLLLRAGADPLARDRHGRSPLGLASYYDDEIKDRLKKGLPRKQSS